MCGLYMPPFPSLICTFPSHLSPLHVLCTVLFCTVLQEEQILYAGLDAWILTQLFDSILMTSELSMNSDIKSVVRSLCKEYYVSVPDPLKNFIVSTDIPEERTTPFSVTLDDLNKISRKNNGELGGENDDVIVMKKSLPLNAMKMRELNMPKKWEPQRLQ